ncbi:MAG: hypothetical protein ACK56F_14670, partial [bacterium]
MVADRHPLVVGQQRIVGAEHAAHVRGVVHRRVEVGVVTHLHRQKQFGVTLPHEGMLGRLLLV